MQEHKKEKHTSVEQNLTQDYIPKSKLGNLPVSNQISDVLKKQMDKTKENIEEYKKEITKKFKYIQSIGIIPSQSSKIIEEEYGISEEDAKKKLIHILVLIPETNFKEIGAIRMESINFAKKINNKFWVHILTPVDLWNLCLDSKFNVAESLAMSFPIFDKGLLASIRVAQIHKTLGLKKFEKYITSYIIAGSLVRGEATKDSDVDVAVIIDDTDVKKMPRLELKEKLRNIIAGAHWQEATTIAGVKNILNVQVWLLTDFWEGVKDANPIFFTFIRDGIPLYDRGTFLPWKSLLRMGKIKPSPEAIDIFMSAGDRVEEGVNRRLLDAVMVDIYWSVVQPTQGLLMLYGLAPPTLQETMRLVRDLLYQKEKLIEKKYVDILETVLIKYYKGYEHGKIKKITGTEVDKLLKNVLDYNKRLKELRKQIETRVEETNIEKIYKDVFGMLESMLKKKSEITIIKAFNEQLVKQGRFPVRFLENLKFIAKVRKEIIESKPKKKVEKDIMTGKEIKKVDRARKVAAEIVNSLIEYNQRCDFLSMEKKKLIIKSRNRIAEVFLLDNLFIVEGNAVSKVENKEIIKSDIEELRKQLVENKNKEIKIDSKSLSLLKKVFGNFELSY